MLSGRFAQVAELVSIILILLGIVGLSQPWSPLLYQRGFPILVAGWIGLSIWSHRRPVRPPTEEGNPQRTINGCPPVEVTLGERPGTW
jgi:hypothetical protein